MDKLIGGKKILITGGTGTLGQALVREVLRYGPEVVRIFSRDEEKQFWMQQELRAHPNVRYLLGDVRDKERLARAMSGVDIVFHTAALKHVPACEYNPFEAVKTNVIGTENVIEVALAENVERVIYTSSDKAISPVNTMGATKLLAERLIAAAAYAKGKSRTIFAAVRFGNVLGSRGSVVPLFYRQVLAGGPVTVTDPEMTRFMMSVGQAVHLALQAATLARGGEVFVLKMPVVRLGDLADVVVEITAPQAGLRPEDIPVEIIGPRPGERLYEELMSAEEAETALELPELFIIPSPFHPSPEGYPGVLPAVVRSYRSDDYPPISKGEVRTLLAQTDLPGWAISDPTTGLCGQHLALAGR
ncbi:MAG: polysaccharide biosynthesis protein [Clostridia bacterium]|nr:MAG: polysaccharide biosynthesis protein [Clostridia bacterium]